MITRSNYFKSCLSIFLLQVWFTYLFTGALSREEQGEQGAALNNIQSALNSVTLTF